MKSKICVPIIVHSQLSLKQQLLQIDINKVDCLEIRLDYYPNINHLNDIDELFSVIIELAKLPYIVTLRTQQEGGYYEGTYNDYQQIYQYILNNYSCYAIDIEWHYVEQASQLIQQAYQKKIQCIISYHNFIEVPNLKTLSLVYKQMNVLPNIIYKFAVYPNNYEDIICLLNFVNTLDKNKQHIIIAMGQFGSISRVVPNLFKSILTFGSLEYSSAPGQITYTKLKELVDLLNEN